jgi:hypothetical protein
MYCYVFSFLLKCFLRFVVGDSGEMETLVEDATCVALLRAVSYDPESLRWLVDSTERVQGVNRHHHEVNHSASVEIQGTNQVANIGLIPMYLYKVSSAKCLAGRTDQAMPVSQWQLLSFWRSYWVF